MATESKFNDDYYCFAADNKYAPWAAQNDICDMIPGSVGQNVTDTFDLVMILLAKKPLPTLHNVWHIFWTIVPTLWFFAIAFITTQQLGMNARDSIRRYLLEFIIICVPVVLSVNVANSACIYFVLFMFICIWLLIYLKKCFALAKVRTGFDLGGRHPRLLTLARATINILTSVCILAIDFDSFPKSFRKSRYYGASLMDVGIGLFVFSMGSVSRRPTRANDLRKLFKTVIPILLLGLTRTVVIECIEYHQDEHEYGRHLNAFFTLGLTKLFGTFISGMAINDGQLVPIGLCVLTLHETTLSLGVSDYVMDPDMERKTFLTSNREGIYSLPGFVGIYILSMYIGQWLQLQTTLKYNEFMQKLKAMAVASVVLWLLVFISIFTFGIARVTCNFGYSIWILAIALTMTMLYLFVFDFVLNTIWPVESSSLSEVIGDAQETAPKPAASIQRSNDSNATRMLPTIVESINRNGLTFFLLANILTGGVNIFLNTGARTNLESVLILTGHMFVATGFVYILQRFKLRIA